MIRGAWAKIHIITVSFDYEADTPQKMKEYGENFTKDFKYWRFATGDKKDYREAYRGIWVLSYQKTKEGFDHINMISIMDLKR